MIKTHPGEPLGTHFITLPWVRVALGVSSISFISVGSAQAAQASVDRAPPPSLGTLPEHRPSSHNGQEQVVTSRVGLLHT